MRSGQKEVLIHYIHQCLDELGTTNLKKDLNLGVKHPAKEFEKETGLTGLSQQYTLPKGLTEQTIEDFTCYYGDLIISMRGANNEDEWLRATALTNPFKSYQYLTLEEVESIKPPPPQTGKSKEIWLKKEQDFLHNLSDLWDYLIELNPSLEIIAPNKEYFFSIEAAIFGVTSQYNVDDIYQYVHYVPYAQDLIKKEDPNEKENAKLFNKIAEKLDRRSLYGFPSLKSLKKIRAQIGIKEPAIKKSLKPPSL